MCYVLFVKIICYMLFVLCYSYSLKLFTLNYLSYTVLYIISNIFLYVLKIKI